MQSSSTGEGTDSGGEGTCPVCTATHLTWTTPTAFQVLLGKWATFTLQAILNSNLQVTRVHGHNFQSLP